MYSAVILHVAPRLATWLVYACSLALIFSCNIWTKSSQIFKRVMYLAGRAWGRCLFFSRLGHVLWVYQWWCSSPLIWHLSSWWAKAYLVKWCRSPLPNDKISSQRLTDFIQIQPPVNVTPSMHYWDNLSRGEVIIYTAWGAACTYCDLHFKFLLLTKKAIPHVKLRMETCVISMQVVQFSKTPWLAYSCYMIEHPNGWQYQLHLVVNETTPSGSLQILSEDRHTVDQLLLRIHQGCLVTSGLHNAIRHSNPAGFVILHALIVHQQDIHYTSPRLQLEILLLYKVAFRSSIWRTSSPETLLLQPGLIRHAGNEEQTPCTNWEFANICTYMCLFHSTIWFCLGKFSVTLQTSASC